MFIHSAHYSPGNSYLIDNLKENKYLFNYHYYGDHLSNRDRFALIKHLYDGSEVILFSCEAQEHSWRYSRLSRGAKAYFTHLDKKNSIYYNLFFEEALTSNFFYNSSYPRSLIKKSGTVLISSNNLKIMRFKSKYEEIFAQADLYGLLSKNVPINPSNNYYFAAQNLSEGYAAAICLDNSFEIGYFQGSPMMHLHAGTVPIYHGPNYWKNFINKDYIIELDTYAKLNSNQRVEAIKRVSEKIENAKGVFFTDLTIDYLGFLMSSISAEKIDFNNMITKSNEYRSKFLKG